MKLACLLLSHRPLWALAALWTLCVPGQGRAAEVHVAVAANFSAPMQKIATAFEVQTGHRVRSALGSSGKLATQIKAGAPFEVFLSADSQTPLALEADGLTIVGSRITYAIGRLALWSRQTDLVDAQGAVLRKGNFSYLAMADPRLAPYGAAALEVLKSMGLWPSLQSRVVQADSVGQTYQFVASGNAEMGFVAWAQVQEAQQKGSFWLVPTALHSPLRQEAVLLQKGKDNPAAQAFMPFLKSPQAQAIILSYGYTVYP